MNLVSYLFHVAALCSGNFAYVYKMTELISALVALCLLVKVVEDIFHYFSYAFRRKISLFPVNIPYFLVVNIRLLVHRLYIVHAERKHVFVVYRVDNRIGMQLHTESLLCRTQCRIF